MPTVWESIVKTALIGAERHPLSAADLAALGMPVPPADPARAALEALATAHCAAKRVFLLADAPPERPYRHPAMSGPCAAWLLWRCGGSC